MIKLTADDLRQLADRIENREKYGNMCGVVYLTIKEHPNGRITRAYQNGYYKDREYRTLCNAYLHIKEGFRIVLGLDR